MVKQLIIAAMLLLIYDVTDAIHYSCVILDITIPVQYVLYDNKTLRYIEDVLYRLEKTKITFEHQQLIDFKICQPTFNYPNFYALSHFIQCIWDYSNVVNYDTAYSKAAYKYLFKTFYNQTNKKGYNLQIWQYNVCHINIIVIKNVIIIEKTGEKKELSKAIPDTTMSSEVT